MDIVLSDVIENYRFIEEARKKYGKLRKCEFHIHTPASYDYRLVPGGIFSKMSPEFVIEVALQEGYLNENQRDKLLDELELGNLSGIKYIEHLSSKEIPYDSFKEYLGYMLIAHKLYTESVEVVVISDHNTINGYEKLKYALDIYYKEEFKKLNRNIKSIHLFMGVEISCSDHNHVVGIFDAVSKQKVEDFLTKHISSDRLGTYETSLTIINRISNLGGLAYIAHINTSKFNGTGFYNNTLFSSENLNILGLTNFNQKDVINKKIQPYVNGSAKQFCYVHEGDSHELKEIGQKNTWIKFSSYSFAALKQAFTNHNFCIYCEKPSFTDKFIKGIMVYPGEKGFLSTNQDFGRKEFFVDFSRDLNCIIGGRGTGKSTLLNIIEIVFSMEVSNYEQLKFISKHERVYILFSYKSNDYLIRFIPQTGNIKSYTQRDFFLDKAFKESILNEKGKIVLSENWLELFRLSGDTKEIKGFEKYEILNNVYRQNYSINNIVNRIDNGEIGDFIKEVIFDGLSFQQLEIFLRDLKRIPHRSLRVYLSKYLKETIEYLRKRNNLVEQEIDSFNIKYQNFIQIKYSPKVQNVESYLELLFDRIPMKRHVAGTLLTWRQVESYVYDFVKQVGYLEFLNLIMSGKFKEMDEILEIQHYLSSYPLSTRDVDEEYAPISKENQSQVFKEIQRKLIEDRIGLETSLELFFNVIDDFTILFDVNSKDSLETKGVLMKNIEELSLGQKVVAILTFIFEYGIHSKDNTPLIIDQPEDNLDNQYIL